MTSTGQDSMLVDVVRRSPCEAELPCIENAIIIGEGKDDDRQLASEITIVCSDGYALPDGVFMKDIHCERVIDEKGRVITQWQDLGGGCKRKY